MATAVANHKIEVSIVVGPWVEQHRSTRSQNISCFGIFLNTD
jgi:hypothetical protein